MSQPSGTLLAFDVGSRCVGVAVGSRLADPRPLAVLPAQPETQLWQAVERLLREWRPGTLLVGLPLTLDGGEQPASVRARAFAASLRNRDGVSVVEVDERGTTRQARERFAAARAAGQLRRRAGEQIDAMAAALIMERYLATAPD